MSTQIDPTEVDFIVEHIESRADLCSFDDIIASLSLNPVIASLVQLSDTTLHRCQRYQYKRYISLYHIWCRAIRSRDRTEARMSNAKYLPTSKLWNAILTYLYPPNGPSKRTKAKVNQHVLFIHLHGPDIYQHMFFSHTNQYVVSDLLTSYREWQLQQRSIDNLGQWVQQMLKQKDNLIGPSATDVVNDSGMYMTICIVGTVTRSHCWMLANVCSATVCLCMYGLMHMYTQMGLVVT